MTRYRVLILALPLFLVLAQGCLAGPPATSWNTVSFNRMSVADCVRWGARALEQEGYTNTQPLGDDLYAEKGPHGAIMVCSAPPTVTIVVVTSLAGADATREQQALQNRFQLESRLHERDHRR
ncbi:MAG TPA: hypothetical protein VKF41_09960 [Bryobacteraceae bacterium]|nr:hypothetical protein [Bryobacteraceae bacterium]